MRDDRFGFGAIARRHRHLGGDPHTVAVEQQIDLADALATIHGNDYAAHPRLHNLIDLNDLPNGGLLHVKETEEAWNLGETESVLASTLRKVDTISVLFQLAVTGSLKTESANDNRTATAGYLDLIVDSENRTVRRKHNLHAVKLSSREVLWHTFRVFFEAGADDASMVDWKSGYPGEFDARHAAVKELRIALIPLDIGIPLRTRHFTDGTSEIS